jgi:hypothetical protein
MTDMPRETRFLRSHVSRAEGLGVLCMPAAPEHGQSTESLASK